MFMKKESYSNHVLKIEMRTYVRLIITNESQAIDTSCFVMKG